MESGQCNDMHALSQAGNWGAEEGAWLLQRIFKCLERGVLTLPLLPDKAVIVMPFMGKGFPTWICLKGGLEAANRKQRPRSNPNSSLNGCVIALFFHLQSKAEGVCNDCKVLCSIIAFNSTETFQSLSQAMKYSPAMFACLKQAEMQTPKPGAYQRWPSASCERMDSIQDSQLIIAGLLGPGWLD